MYNSEIVRAASWNNRRPLCRKYGWRYLVVFKSNVACKHRINIKTWAWDKFGAPGTLTHSWYMDNKGNRIQKLKNPDSEWFAGFLTYSRSDKDEYYIAFKNEKYRDFALYL